MISMFDQQHARRSAAFLTSGQSLITAAPACPAGSRPRKSRNRGERVEKAEMGPTPTPTPTTPYPHSRLLTSCPCRLLGGCGRCRPGRPGWAAPFSGAACSRCQPRWTPGKACRKEAREEGESLRRKPSPPASVAKRFKRYEISHSLPRIPCKWAQARQSTWPPHWYCHAVLPGLQFLSGGNDVQLGQGGCSCYCLVSSVRSPQDSR